MVKPGKFVIKTDAGPLQVIWDGKDSDKIEVQIGGVYIDEAPVTLYGFTFHKVNVGNPHAVTFVDNVELAPIKEVGPKVEINDHFPNRTNVEFVQIINSSTIQVRTWERGSGETLACGTAMVAAAAVAVKFKGAHYPIAVNVLGGSARVWLDDEKYMRMVGPASYS
jgi:diaminopimelate epimerase